MWKNKEGKRFLAALLALLFSCLFCWAAYAQEAVPRNSTPSSELLNLADDLSSVNNEFKEQTEQLLKYQQDLQTCRQDLQRVQEDLTKSSADCAALQAKLNGWKIAATITFSVSIVATTVTIITLVRRNQNE